MEFAVILLDVNMPDIDGLETASLIRQYKKSAQTPIVFITAYVDEDQAAGLRAGRGRLHPVAGGARRCCAPRSRVFVELHRMNRQLQKQAVEREALARSEAARTAAEDAIHRADYLSEASQRLSRSLNIDDTARALLDLAVPMLARARPSLGMDGWRRALPRSLGSIAAPRAGIAGMPPRAEPGHGGGGARPCRAHDRAVPSCARRPRCIAALAARSAP
jgi:CheY-like chemotaxis protein